MLTLVFWLSLYIFHENTTFFFFIYFGMTSEFLYFLTSSLLGKEAGQPLTEEFVVLPNLPVVFF